jgi:multiple sugar transport system substrate-binding protein
VTLLFPTHLWAQNEWLTEVSDAYKAAHPDITVQPADAPFGTYHDKAFTDMVSGNAPDIVVPYDTQIVQWAQLDLLEPLNPWLEEAGWTADRIENELIATQQLAIQDGNVYGILQQSNPRILVYNQKILDAAGVAVPNNEVEYLNALRAVTDESKNQFGTLSGSANMSATDVWSLIQPTIVGFGGAFMRDNEPNATAPETVAALQLLKTINDEGLAPVSQSYANQEALFSAGKIAFALSGSFTVGGVQNDNPDLLPSINARTLPLPGNSTISVNVFFSVPESAKNKDAAARFLVSLLDEEPQRSLTSTYVALGARPDIGVTEEFLAERPWFAAVQEAGKVAVPNLPEAPGPVMSKVQEVVRLRYGEMLQGATAADTAAAIQKDLEELVAPLTP